MHNVKIPDSVLQEARNRRGGKRFAFDPLVPEKTALLIVDMQIFFVQSGEDGQPGYAQGIVPNINRLASCFRETGGTVIWVTSNFGSNIESEWSVLMREIYSPERSRVIIDNLRDGGAGFPLWPDLDVHVDDWQVEKDRFSALIHGASNLEDRLRQAGLDTVVVTGTLTNVCCESTARDAMMRNFRTLMVTDANAAGSDDDHNNSLAGMARVFVDILDTDELISRMSETTVETS
jgi:ureidoacrylate peracid hydrolase